MAYMGPAFNTFDVNFNFSDLVLDAGDIAENGDLLQYDLANAQWLTVSNLTIPGNLIVNGTTTTVNSTTITVDDPIFTLGGDTAPTSDDSKDRGIEFRWHDGANAKVGFFGFDNGTGSLTYIPDATNTGEVFSGTPGSVIFSDATFSGNTAIKIPVGGTADRPTALQGHMRYNTDTSQFEGYDGNNWSGLGGIIDVDQDTYITAEETADADTLKMYTGGSLAVTVGSDQNVSFDSNGAIVVPVGTTAERPASLAQGMIRYNTDDSTFEGYDGGTWGSLGGVKDVDQDTYIEAEQSADDDTLRFYTAGVERMTIDGTGNINFNGGLELGLQATVTGEVTTSATTQVALDNWSITEYRTAKYMLQAVDTDSNEYHISELMVVHDGTSAFATEYGTIHTGTNPLASYDVDVNSNAVRVLATPASTNNTNFKFSRNALTPEPTFSLASSSASINEGDAVTFTLTTTQVSNGTAVPYTITGIQSADLSVGSLTGNFTVNNNTATNAFTLSADATTEGSETLTLALDNGQASSAVTIGDTSLDPTYTLSADNTTINEGASVVITLTTTDVPDATNIAYTVTGVDTDDLTAGTLTGNFTIASNTATVTFTLAEDTTTEGDETLTLTLDNGAGNIAITITDSSTTPANNSGTTATLAQTLINPNPDSTSAGDKFGHGAAIAGDYAIVGAYGEGTGVTDQSGKAYVYNVADGSLVYTLNNPNAYGTEGGDRFGYAVAISTNYAIVGAYQEDDAQGTTSGKAYVFDLSNGSLAYTLDNPNPVNAGSSGSSDDHFGRTVGIGTTHAIVGAPQEWKAGADPSFRASGKAYIFDLSNGSLAYTLDNPNAYGTTDYDRFGDKVAISDTYAIVSTAMEDDAGGTYSGKAYIYDLSNGSLTYTLDNPNPSGTSANDYFGISCAISDTHAIVGAYGEEDSGGSTSGKAYIYTLSNGNLLHTLDNPNAYNTSQGDNFGETVGISDTYALVAAPSEDDAQGGGRGKAYIFKISDGSLLATIDNPNTSSLYNPLGDKAVGITDTHAILGSSDYDDSGGSNTDSSGRAFIYNITTTSGGNQSIQVTPALPSNIWGSSTSNDWGHMERLSTNGTYTVVGDPGMDIVHNGQNVNNPGWAWIYRNSDGQEMKSWNSILDGTAPDDGSLNAYTSTASGTSKYHYMSFGYNTAINDDYAFISAPLSYDGSTGNNYNNGGYIVVIKLSDMSHARTFDMPTQLSGAGAPAYPGAGTYFGAAGMTCNANWLLVGASKHNVGGTAEAGAVVAYDISDADPANWTYQFIENPNPNATPWQPVPNSGTFPQRGFGNGLTIENNRFASTYFGTLSVWDYSSGSWSENLTRNENFYPQNNSPTNNVLDGDRFLYTKTNSTQVTPNYAAYIKALDITNNFTELSSDQITEGNAYPGYKLVRDGDFIYTSDSGYVVDSKNNVGRIMKYKLSDSTHVENIEAFKEHGNADATNTYFGYSWDIKNGKLVAYEENNSTGAEYLVFKDLNAAPSVYGLTGVSYTGGTADTVSMQGHNPYDLSWAHDGTKLFVTDNNGTMKQWNQTSTNTWNANYLSYQNNISHSLPDSPVNVAWGTQGSYVNMYLGTGSSSNSDLLFQTYLCNTPYDWTSYIGYFYSAWRTNVNTLHTILTNAGIATGVASDLVYNADKVKFSADGNYMILFAGQSHNMAIAVAETQAPFEAQIQGSGWISGALLGSLVPGNISTGGNKDFVFNTAGTKLYIARDVSGSRGVVEFTLSTPYDVSTATYTTMLDLSGFCNNLYSIALNDTDDRLYTAGYGLINTPALTTGTFIRHWDLVQQGGSGSGGGGGSSVWYGDRGLLMGGYHGESDNSGFGRIEYFDIATLGNSSNFGDLTEQRYGNKACSNGTRALATGGTTEPSKTNMEYATIATLGNAIAFGDLLVKKYAHEAVSDGTYGLSIGGNGGASNTVLNDIEYVTIDNTGNGADFGDLIIGRKGLAGAANATRGIVAGGNGSGSGGADYERSIEYITIATPGNALSFGDLLAEPSPNTSNNKGKSYHFAVGDSTRIVWASGKTNYNVRTNGMSYAEFDTPGNSVDFGDVTVGRHMGTSVDNSSRGVFMGGSAGSLTQTDNGYYVNTIDYITIQTPSNATDFGDLQYVTQRGGGASGSAS